MMWAFHIFWGCVVLGSLFVGFFLGFLVHMWTIEEVNDD